MSLLSFKKFIISENKTMTFCVLESAIPSMIDKLMIEKTSVLSGGNEFRILVSTSPEENYVLSLHERLKYTRKMFPKFGRQTSMTENSSISSVIEDMRNSGYKKINLVCSTDQSESYSRLLGEDISIFSVRQPQVDFSSMIETDNFLEFSQYIPEISNYETKRLFGVIKEKTGVRFKRSRNAFFPKNSVREDYLRGKLFTVGDIVVDKHNNKLTISRLCSNYVIAESENNKNKRYWLKDLTKIEENHGR